MTDTLEPASQLIADFILAIDWTTKTLRLDLATSAIERYNAMQITFLRKELDEAFMQLTVGAWQPIDFCAGLAETIVNIIGGTVEGDPTHRGNYLQRLRQLLDAEAQLTARDASAALVKQKQETII